MRNLCTLLISLCASCVQGLLPESFTLMPGFLETNAVSAALRLPGSGTISNGNHIKRV